MSGTGYDPGSVPGPPGPAGDFLALESIDDLRALVAVLPDAVVVVNQAGRWGLFYWDTTPAVDDGGTRFNVGGLGTTSAGWNRDFEGAYIATWFGLGTGDVDNTTALNLTVLGALLRQAVSPDAQVSQPDILVPAGSYAIAASWSLTNYFGHIHAEGAVLTTPDTTLDMVTGIGKNMSIEGLALEGGANGFVIDTNNLDGVVITFDRVQTRVLTKQAIKASSDSNSAILNISNSRFLFEEAGAEVGFDFGGLDHVNFVDNWVTSKRVQTIYNRSSRLRVRGCIFVPQTSGGTDYWITNESGSVWVIQNMFSGEDGGRPILWSTAAANSALSRSIEVSSNLLYSPATDNGRGPFKIGPIPNEVKIFDNVGLLGITQARGLGIEWSGYQAFGAQSYIDVDSQFLRQASAASDDVVRNTILARANVPRPASYLTLLDAARSLEFGEAGNSDYGQASGGTTTNGTTTNAAGLTVFTAQASGNGQSYFYGYTIALTGLPDGCYTLIVPITVSGPACEVLLEGGDIIERFHVTQGRRLLALPFVWLAGTTADTIQVEGRDLPNGCSVAIEPYQIMAGHVDPNAKMFGTAAPVGNSGYRWLKGAVIWDDNPTSGQFIGRVCTASSARVAAKSFGPGTWKTFGAIS